MSLKYNRILLKISGEALAGEARFGIDENMVEKICAQIKEVVELGVEVGIVCGGGNFWRGRNAINMERTRADHAGMLATVINALALQDALLKRGVEARVQTAIEMRAIAEPYIRGKALSHFKHNYVVIFAAGTGSPFFSTDTAAALRATEIGADALLLAKNIDGVYTADPKIDSEAKLIKKISYLDVIKQRLAVMDTTATSLCMDNKVPLRVFGIDVPNSIVKIVMGEDIGTEVHD